MAWGDDAGSCSFDFTRRGICAECGVHMNDPMSERVQCHYTGGKTYCAAHCSVHRHGRD